MLHRFHLYLFFDQVFFIAYGSEHLDLLLGMLDVEVGNVIKRPADLFSLAQICFKYG